MAVFTRVNGDARSVQNTGAASRTDANAAIAVTGIANPIHFVRIEVGGNLAAQLGSGGAVESMLNSISSNATVLGYQVDSTTDAGALGSQLSVIIERSAWTSNAALASVIAAAGTVNGMSLSGVRVYGDKGLNLARGTVATGSSHSIAG